MTQGSARAERELQWRHILWGTALGADIAVMLMAFAKYEWDALAPIMLVGGILAYSWWYEVVLLDRAGEDFWSLAASVLVLIGCVAYAMAVLLFPQYWFWPFEILLIMVAIKSSAYRRAMVRHYPVQSSESRHARAGSLFTWSWVAAGFFAAVLASIAAGSSSSVTVASHPLSLARMGYVSGLLFVCCFYVQAYFTAPDERH